MDLLIGMDEAGYGPNLGPLVITVTSWSLPDDPVKCDVWQLLDHAVAQSPSRNNGKLHVADSKEVYRSSNGLANLERSALCILKLAGFEPTSLNELWQMLALSLPEDTDQEPWYAAIDVPLPVVCERSQIDRDTDALRMCAAQTGISCRQIRSDIVLTRRFNELTAQHDSKGQALSRMSLSLLRSVWDPDDGNQVFVVADKHGGRNRYDHLLAEVLEDRMIFRVCEGRERSDYRVGQTLLRFQTRAESHFPVAVASIISKYVRELAMRAFNEFWQREVSGLQATAGYPVDAKRFRQHIADRQTALSISDDVLWRLR